MACPSESVMNAVCYNQAPMQNCIAQVYGQQNLQGYEICPQPFFSNPINPPAFQKPLTTENMSQEAMVQTEEKPYVCKMCSQAFGQSDELTKHQSLCAGSKEFKCDSCPEKFGRSSDLIEHRRVHPPEKPYKCDMCPKAFSQNAHLARHKIVHSNDGSYGGSVNRNSFSSVGIGAGTHADMRPHKCPICPKSFMLISDLEKHQRVHSGKEYKAYPGSFSQEHDSADHQGRSSQNSAGKPFKCAVCSKCYASSSDLGKHVLVHSGEKPFKCNVCPKAYTRVDHLTRHQMVHTGEKPHKCDVCLKCFCRKDHLAKHKRTHTIDHSSL